MITMLLNGALAPFQYVWTLPIARTSIQRFREFGLESTFMPVVLIFPILILIAAYCINLLLICWHPYFRWNILGRCLIRFIEEFSFFLMIPASNEVVRFFVKGDHLVDAIFGGLFLLALFVFLMRVSIHFCFWKPWKWGSWFSNMYQGVYQKR